MVVVFSVFWRGYGARVWQWRGYPAERRHVFMCLVWWFEVINAAEGSFSVLFAPATVDVSLVFVFLKLFFLGCERLFVFARVVRAGRGFCGRCECRFGCVFRKSSSCSALSSLWKSLFGRANVNSYSIVSSGRRAVALRKGPGSGYAESPANEVCTHSS